MPAREMPWFAIIILAKYTWRQTNVILATKLKIQHRDDIKKQNQAQFQRKHLIATSNQMQC